MRLSLFCLTAFLLLAANHSLLAQEKTDKITYDDNVKELLKSRCFSCHNTDQKKGDLDLSSYGTMMRGGSSGTVIEPGDSDGSYLFALVSHSDEPKMPPESDRIPDAELALLKNWIDGGALEAKSSVAKMKPKKKFDFALSDPASGKPENVAMPAILPLETEVDAIHGTATTAIATSPWAPLVALAGHKQVMLYNSQTLELTGVLPFPEGQPNVLKFSRNGSLLLVSGGRGGANGKAVLFDVKSGQRVVEVGDELDAVLAADVSPDQTKIAVGGPQRLVRVYSTETGELLFEIKKHTDWVTALEFSPDGVLLASGDRNGGLHVWEAHTAREYLVLKAHTAMITGISWRSDSNVVASSSEDTNIRLWELENGNQIKAWGAHGGGVLDLEFARDGRLVSTGRDKVTKVWDQNGQQLIAFPAFADIGVRCSICDESNRVITGDWLGQVQVFNAADGAVLAALESNPPKLEVRLASAQQSLQQVTAQHEAMAKAAADALAAADTAKAQLAAAQKAFTDNQEKEKQLVAVQTTLNAEIPKLAEQIKATTDRVQKLQTAVPLLKAAKENADKAVAQLGDEETKTAAAQIATVLQTRESEMTTVETELATLTKQMETKKAELEAATKELAVVTAAIATARQMVDTITPTIAPLDQKVAETKQAADASAAQVNAATEKVTKLNAAIEFAGKYGELTTALQTATTAHEAQYVAWQEQIAALNTGKQQLAEKQTQLAAANASLAQTKQAQTDQQTIYAAAQKAKTDNDTQIAAYAAEADGLAKLIPMLDEVIAKLQAISTAAPNDKEIADQLAGSKALSEKRKLRNTELASLAEAAKANIPALDKAIADAQVALDSATKAVETAQAAVTAVQAENDALAAQVATAEQQIPTAQAAADQAGAQVDAVKQQIAVLQGL